MCPFERCRPFRCEEIGVFKRSCTVSVVVDCDAENLTCCSFFLCVLFKKFSPRFVANLVLKFVPFDLNVNVYTRAARYEH